MHMTWERLLFAHWPVPVEALRSHIPEGLDVDTFEGEAWIGVVPFGMTGVRHRLLPEIPGTSRFPELNVRTYVRSRNGGEARPGVWFFSLDAASRLAVRGARLGFHLPYFDARMGYTETDSTIEYKSERIHRHAPAATFHARYRPVGEAFTPASDTLEDFLTARYCLYTADNRGTILRGEIDHDPWSIAPVEWECESNTMLEQIHLTLPDTPPLLHYAHTIDTIAWSLVRDAG